MTLDEFDRLLLAHGGDPRRWPPGLRDGAEALLAREPAAQALLEEAERLDRTVADAATAPAAGAAFAGRIAAALERESGHADAEPAFGLGRLAAFAGTTAVAALVAGFFFGQSAAAYDISRGIFAIVAGDLAEIEASP